MKLLRRWLSLRYRLRTRRWRQRALMAEDEISNLKRELYAEMWRNREREDMFVSASVMGSKGMFGVKARSGPVAPKQLNPAPVSVQQTYSDNPFDKLSWAEKEEYRMFYLQDGLNAGYSENQIQQRYLEELATRKILNDEIAQ